MNSLRARLFLILLAGTGLVWLCAAGWIYASVDARLDQMLDQRLRASAQMVTSLIADNRLVAAEGQSLAPLRIAASAQRPLTCQVWSLDGQLVARSSGAPDSSLSDATRGFSERQVDGRLWRVYAMEDTATGLRVLVGDEVESREQLVADLLKGLLFPALLVLPLLGLLIWASLARGLRPLRDLARDLRARDAEDMRPVAASRVPAELRPVAKALNGLFAKVSAARRHERELTAFAAHELRTPLAGLKTQAQVALAAPDRAAQQAALRQILAGVDRTARLVRQLLSIARLDAGPEDGARAEPVDLGQVLEEVVGTLRPAPGSGLRVEVAPALRGRMVRADREALSLALRNLHENALHHMPGGGTVRWGLEAAGDAVFVEDEGPGIPPEELPLVTRRFFRGRHKSASGSGLGLAIVELALRQCGAALRLRNRPEGHGLRAEILLGGA